MPKDAPLNSGAPEAPLGSHQRVSGMQTKLHRWAAADHGRRFDDLFNLVCDPATLLVAFERVAGNKEPGPRASTASLSSTLSGNSASRAIWRTCNAY